MRRSFAFCCLLYSLTLPALAGDSLTVLLYHNVSDVTPHSTSVTAEVFEEHLQQLTADGFTVVPLIQAIESVKNGSPLPDRAVAITFDDADNSIYHNAFPLLQQYQMPFTVFVNTEPVDKNYGRAMSWGMLREMKQAGATIANHTRSHDYLVRQPNHDSAWLDAVMADINHAQSRLAEELGSTPKFLAYPYGEYNNTLKQTLAAQGWTAFGQQSGAIDSHSDLTALPRFPAAGIYAKWANLRVKLKSRPLPVSYNALPDPVYREAGAPELSLAFDDSSNVRTDALRCYIQGEALIPEWNDAKDQFVITAPRPLNKGRTRYNCTTPARTGGYYYWFSHQWIKDQA